MYNKKKGSITLDDCQNCEAGTYSEAEGLTKKEDCVDCPPGTYSPKEGATAMLSVTCTVTISSQDITADAGAVVTQYGRTGTLKTALVGATTQIIIDNFLDPCNDEEKFVIKQCSAGVFIADKEYGDGCHATCDGTAYSDDGTGFPDESTCDGDFVAAGDLNYIDILENSISKIDLIELKSCLDCPTGTGTATAGVASIEGCVTCDEGQYQDQKGKTACKRCAKGLFNMEKYQTASTDCVGCVEGRYSTSEGLAVGKDCVECPPVSYFLLQLPSLPFYY